MWTIDTIGIVRSGYHTELNDVTIVNDNEVWIAGLIPMPDGTGNLVIYNLLRWNGSAFDTFAVKFRLSSMLEYQVAANSIYNFGSNNIVVGAGPSVMHWNGTLWTSYLGLYDEGNPNQWRGDVSNGLWGTSLNKLYGVGKGGSIVRWNGSSWTRMPVNTTVDLKDIAGTPDGENMWACGSNPYVVSPSTLQRYKNGQWQTVWEGDSLPFRSDSISGHLMGLMIPNKNKALVLSRYGVYEISAIANTTIRRNSFAPKQFPGFPWSMGGNGENDLFVVGSQSMIAHYNGNTWRQYPEFMNNNGLLESIAQKGSLVVIVGSLQDSFNSRGIVIIGKRQ